jgi:Ala-tRNA(Pro) deacylase
MPSTPDQLFAFFDELGIEHQTVAHPPFFTVEDGRAWHHRIPGLHCKNLFLKDKNGRLWLVVMPGEKRADLAAIAQRTGAGKFSFGKPELLNDTLGISPGSVTPFAVLNDERKAVTVVLDTDMLQSEWVNYHPLHNEASTVMRSQDLVKFLRATGREPLVIDCAA